MSAPTVPAKLAAGDYVVVCASPSEPAVAQFCHHHHKTMRGCEHCRGRIARAAAWTRALLRTKAEKLFRLPAAEPVTIRKPEPSACMIEDAMARRWAAQA